MRITGGVFRSRTLFAPRGHATRPTSDRVREALFSILASRGGVASARVLDVFAGTGALGLEALSRGAAHVVFVESGREALKSLGRNVVALAVGDRATIVDQKIERALSRLEGPFDLVLCDPPYALVRDPAFEETLAALVRLLREGGTLVLEHDSKDPPPPSPPGLAVPFTRLYGDTALSVYSFAHD
jgi:16S rRNA (guanine966-N2)-methyltransferase